MINTCEPDIEEQKYIDSQAAQEELEVSEQENYDTDTSQLQLLADSLYRPIILYFGLDCENYRYFQPENRNTNLSAFELVLDEENHDYYLKLSYQTTDNILDWHKLQCLFKRAPALRKQIPSWVQQFVECDLSAYFKGINGTQSDEKEGVARKIQILANLDAAKNDHTQQQDIESLETLIQRAI